MDSTIPSTAKQWNVTATDGYDSLKFSEQPVPELGDSEVLVKSKFSQGLNLEKQPTSTLSTT